MSEFKQVHAKIASDGTLEGSHIFVDGVEQKVSSARLDFRNDGIVRLTLVHPVPLVEFEGDVDLVAIIGGKKYRPADEIED